MEKCVYCRGDLRGLRRIPSFRRCRGCGLILRDPFPDPQALAALYEAGWRDPDAHLGETGATDPALARQYARELLACVGAADAHGLRLLDFGAGQGALMDALGDLGGEVHGVEPYGHARLRARGKAVHRSLDDLPGGLAFDGVVSMDVVEHLTAPWDTFAALRPRLRPGGWLCVSTPNPHGLNARLSAGRWREARNAGHVLFLGEGTLVRMLRDAGFRRVRPVRWRVRYRPGWPHALTQRLLVAGGLQGSTRVLAYREP